MLLILVEVSVNVACRSTTDCSVRTITVLLSLVEVYVNVACRSTTARLKAQSYLHATYISGSIYHSGLSVHDSHRLSYLHATFSGGSICVSGLSVHRVTDCSHRAITMLIILVEVPVKVACPSTTVTDCSPKTITMLLILVKVFV